MALTLNADPPQLRAAVANNLAAATILEATTTEPVESAAGQANRLSDLAFNMYPCILSYRSTQALSLALQNRPEEGLALLDYVNCSRGNQAERSDQEATRAYLLRRLNRHDEAKVALAKALALSKMRTVWLQALCTADSKGDLAASSATPIATATNLQVPSP